jgi:tRNA dimethylallyltransferase
MERKPEKLNLHVIVGPTCSGKTDLALKIARFLNCDVLSIDSRQVFRELDLGTGKYKGDNLVKKEIALWQIDDTAVFGYDIVPPSNTFNVIDYCNYVKILVATYFPRTKNLVATCGTGFYLSFLMGQVEYSEISSDRKEYLNSLSLESLQEIYKQFEDSKEVDIKNKIRLITRILTLENPDKKLSKFELPNVNFNLYFLNPDRDEVYQSSDQFVEDILDRNIVGEYLDILNKYGQIRPLEGLLYREVGDYLQQKITYEELGQKMKFSMHAYIRRQITYFKKFKFKYQTTDKEDLLNYFLANIKS